MERNNVVKFKGNPLTLVGSELKVGEKAPDFNVLDNSLQPVTLKSSEGHVRLFSVVPSLDTPTCDLQTTRFNKKAAEMPGNVKLYTVSCDLPFAQSRYCVAKAVDKLQTISDHRDVSFGTNYGLLIKELRLLTRAVVIVDQKDIVRYIQIVPEMTEEPDYDDALNALKRIIG